MMVTATKDEGPDTLLSLSPSVLREPNTEKEGRLILLINDMYRALLCVYYVSRTDLSSLNKSPPNPSDISLVIIPFLKIILRWKEVSCLRSFWMVK